MTKEAQLRSNQSVHGLKRECLSYTEVLAQSVAVIAPTTVPAAVLSLIFACSGNGTWLSFLLGMIGLVFVSININQFARRSASPGSLYAYIVKGLGPSAGVLCGWGLVLAYLFTGMSTLCGFALFGQKLLGYLSIDLDIISLFALGTGAAWYAAYKDIKLSAKMMLLLEGFSIVSIVLLGLIVWAHKGFALDPAQLTLQGATPGGVSLGIVLVVFGFSGFESSTSLGDEAKNPLRTIPKSVLQSTLLAGVFFIFMTYIVVLGFSGTSVDLGKTEAPLDVLAHQVGVDFLGVLISVGALLSFFSCTLACINPTARVFFLMARHGLFHKSLGKTHHSNLTPHVAIAWSSLLTFLVPAALNLLSVKAFDSQGYFGTISTYGFLLVYILVSIAAPVYLYQLRKLRTWDVVFSVLGVVFMLLPIVGTIGIPGSGVFPPPAPPQNLFPYLFLLYLAVGCGWFILQKWRSPRVVEEMQESVNAIHARFNETGSNEFSVEQTQKRGEAETGEASQQGIQTPPERVWSKPVGDQEDEGDKGTQGTVEDSSNQPTTDDPTPPERRTTDAPIQEGSDTHGIPSLPDPVLEERSHSASLLKSVCVSSSSQTLESEVMNVEFITTTNSKSSVKKPNKDIQAIVNIVLLLLALTIICSFFVIVNAGERGVLMRFGEVQPEILSEGIHPVVPIVHTVEKLSVRVQNEEISTEASSKDLQTVYTDVALNWHIIPEKVKEIFQRIGNQKAIVHRIINPAVKEVLKSVTASYSAEEIITKRRQVKTEFDQALISRLANYDIEIDDISLVNIHFSQQFNQAVEAKQIAEQEAKRAGFLALKAESQAKAEVNLAEGEAKAHRLILDTLTPAMLQRQAIAKWDGRMPWISAGGGDNTRLFQLELDEIVKAAQKNPNQERVESRDELTSKLLKH